MTPWIIVKRMQVHLVRNMSYLLLIRHYFHNLQLKLSESEYRNVLIPRLGGLRISWNLLKAIGQHMQDAGLHVM